MKENLGPIIVLFIITIIGIGVYSTRKGYKKAIETLTSINAQHVTVFRIYPKVYRPFGEPVEFNTPDPIIDAFFQALTDLRSYPTSRDTAYQEQTWFLEIATRDFMIQIAFYIPSQKGNIVVGEIGEFSKSGGRYDAEFQSRKLFQWYQKYKDRWLEPDGKEGGEEGEKKRRAEEQKSRS